MYNDVYIYIDVYIDVYIYVYIYIHTYRLDSSFIFIHDIYQVVQDFAQRNGKTRCCKLVRQNAEHIYRLVFPGASYCLPFLGRQTLCRCFFAVATLVPHHDRRICRIREFTPNRVWWWERENLQMCRSSWPKCACLHLKRSRAIGFAGKGRRFSRNYDINSV